MISQNSSTPSLLLLHRRLMNRKVMEVCPRDRTREKERERDRKRERERNEGGKRSSLEGLLLAKKIVTQKIAQDRKGVNPIKLYNYRKIDISLISLNSLVIRKILECVTSVILSL